MLTPLFVGLLEYAVIYFGICPIYGGIIVPWTTPPIISGFLVGDWRTALLQVVVIVFSFMMYLPFIRKVDKEAYKQEHPSK